MEFYMQFLVALYEESSQSYSLLGLTERECQMIMNERLAKMALDWSEARVDEEGELITRANMAYRIPYIYFQIFYIDPLELFRPVSCFFLCLLFIPIKVSFASFSFLTTSSLLQKTEKNVQ